MKNKYKLSVWAGWFKGETFKLFSLTFGADGRGAGFITIIDFQIAKFSFQVMLDII